MKIMTLLFLLIYSRSLHTPCFLGPHDTLLLCVLITTWLCEIINFKKQ